VTGELVALQSLSTIKKGTSPFNFQPNEPFSKSKMWIESVWKTDGRRGKVILPPITFDYKGNRPFNFQFNDSF
jgi:hypothetical protein